MRFNFTSNAFALFCLIATVWASLATSSGQSFSGSYAVKSDCVQPTVDTTVTVVNNQITSGVTDYNSLGFPNNSLSLGASNSGYITGGVLRECENTLKAGESIKDSFLYTCKDDGQFACNVYFESN